MSIIKSVVALGGNHTSLFEADRPEGTRDSRGASQTFQIFLPHQRPVTVSVEEAWWDPRINEPSAWSVAFACFLYIPFFVLQSSALWIARYSSFRTMPEPRITLDPRKSISDLLRILHFATAVLPAAALGYLLAPIAVLASVAALPVYGILRLLALLKLPPAKVLVKKVRFIFVNVLGDLWAYLDADSGRDIVEFVTERMKTMQRECDKVVVVGHSQGGELARRACLNVPITAAYVAVGSGQHQLNGARTLRQNRLLNVVTWVVTAAIPIFIWWTTNRALSSISHTLQTSVSSMATILTTGRDTDPWAMLRYWWHSEALADAVLISGLLLTMGMLFLVSRPVDAHQMPKCPTWFVRSAWDPVSFGVGTSDQRVRSVTPTNKLTEHVTYFEKEETGNTLLEAIYGPGKIQPLRAEESSTSFRWKCLLFVATVVSLGGLYLLGEFQFGFLEKILRGPS